MPCSRTELVKLLERASRAGIAFRVAPEGLRVAYPRPMTGEAEFVAERLKAVREELTAILTDGHGCRCCSSMVFCPADSRNFCDRVGCPYRR